MRMVTSPGTTPSVVDPSGPSPDWAAAGRSVTDAAKASGSIRGTSAIIAVMAMALLMVAWVLEPSEDGLGTHRQLGLPVCGFIASLDMPCPTCGMTTAFSHAADGSLVSSFIAQPLGMLLALGCAILVLVGGYTAVTGSMLAPFLADRVGPRIGWVLVGLLIAAWIWKIVDHRELL